VRFAPTPFRSGNKKEFIHHLRHGEFFWPFMPEYWESPFEFGWVGYHAVEYKSLQKLLSFQYLPKYLRAKIEKDPAFSHGGRSYFIFVTRGEVDTSQVGEFAGLLKSMVAADVPDSSKRALSMWTAPTVPPCDAEETRFDKTLVSAVWNESFSSPFLPFKTKDRSKVLKRDSPIRKYI
jgi:hypothetical protein